MSDTNDTTERDAYVASLGVDPDAWASGFTNRMLELDETERQTILSNPVAIQGYMKDWFSAALGAGDQAGYDRGYSAGQAATPPIAPPAEPTDDGASQS